MNGTGGQDNTAQCSVLDHGHQLQNMTSSHHHGPNAEHAMSYISTQDCSVKQNDRLLYFDSDDNHLQQLQPKKHLEVVIQQKKEPNTIDEFDVLGQRYEPELYSDDGTYFDANRQLFEAHQYRQLRRRELNM